MVSPSQPFSCPDLVVALVLWLQCRNVLETDQLGWTQAEAGYSSLATAWNSGQQLGRSAAWQVSSYSVCRMRVGLSKLAAAERRSGCAEACLEACSGALPALHSSKG